MPAKREQKKKSFTPWACHGLFFIFVDLPGHQGKNHQPDHKPRTRAIPNEIPRSRGQFTLVPGGFSELRKDNINPHVNHPAPPPLLDLIPRQFQWY